MKLTHLNTVPAARTSPAAPAPARLATKFASKQAGWMRLAAVLALFVASLAPPPAAAATYYWDCNGSTAGFGTAGGGWATSPYWSTTSTGTASPGYATTTTADDVNFGTASTGLGAGTVTGPSSAQGFRTMIFGAASDWILFNGGNLTLAAPAASIIVNNYEVTFQPVVLGGAGAGLIKDGPGQLDLNNGSHCTYSGSTTVSNGLLRLVYGSINSSTNIYVYGGTLETTYNNTLSDAAEVTVAGGNLVWGDASTDTIKCLYIGPGSVSGGGTIVLNNGGSTGIRNTTANNTVACKINLGSSGLDIGCDSGTLTLSGVVSSTYNYGLDIYPSTSAVTLSATNTYTGPTTISGGTLTIGGAGQLGSGNYSASIYNYGALVYNSSAAQTLGHLYGTGTLTKSGTGTLTLSGANDYSGLTTVSGGTLVLGHPNDTLDGPITVSGGTLNVDNPDTVGAVTLSSGSIIGDSTLTGSSYSVEGGTISAILAGSGGLTKTTTGTVTFTAANAYSGLTTISGGTLVLGHATDTLDGAITVSGGTLKVDNNDTVGAVTLTSGSISGDSTLTGSSYAVESGSISAVLAGSAALTKSTAGTVSLSDRNTYTGLTTINGGTLGLDNGGGTPGIVGDIVVNSGGTLAFSSYNQLGGVYHGNAPANTVTLNSGGTLSWTNTVESFNNLTLNNTSLALNGGFAADTLWGALNIYDTLTATGASSITAASGSYNRLSPGAATGPVTLNANVPGPSDSLNIAVSIRDYDTASTYALTKSGNGTLTLSAANTYDGLTTVNGGTLVLGHASDTLDGPITVSGGTLNVDNPDTVGAVTLVSGSINGDSALTGSSYDVRNGTVSAVLAGSGALTKSTDGTVTLSDVNTYSGSTTVSAGTLYLNGGINSSTSVNVSGGTLDNGVGNTLADTATVTVSGGTLAVSQSDQIKSLSISGGTVSGTGPLILANAGGRGIYSASGNNAIDCSVELGSQNTPIDCLDIGSSSGVLTFNGVISSGASYGMDIWPRNSTVVFANNNTYAGPTYVYATLRLGIDNGINPGNNVWLDASGVFDLNGHNQTLNSITNAGTVTLNGGVLTLGSGNSSFTYDGVVSGTTGGITKTGSGAMTLTAANTYSGLTTVSGGTLVLGHATDTLDGPITINGGTLNVDNPDTVGAVTLVSGSIIGDCALTGSSYDVRSGTIGAVLAGSGTFTKTTGGTVTVSVNSALMGDIVVSGGTLAALARPCAADNAPRIIVNSGGTMSFRNANLFGNHWDTTIPTIEINAGGTVSNDMLNNPLNNVELNGGTLTAAASQGANWRSWAINGSIISTGNSTISPGTAPDPGVLLKCAGSALWDTTVNVVNGTLSISAPLVNGRDAVSPYPAHATGVTKTGTGTLVLSGNNAYTGQTTISGGTLTISGVGLLGSGSYSAAMANNAAFVYDSPYVQYLQGVISGAGTLTKSATGTLVLTAANTYSGLTTVSGGTLVLGHATDTLDGPITVSGGTLNVDNPDTVGDVILTSGYITGDSALTGSSYEVQSGTISSVLAGAGTLTKTAAGTVTLSAANTYSGLTTVSEGTLVLGHVSDTLDGAITVSGGTLNVDNPATVGTVTLASGSITGDSALTGSSYAVESGTISVILAGSGGLTKSTAGTVTLSRANTYSGLTRINEGTLKLNNTYGTRGLIGDITINSGGALAFSQYNQLGGVYYGNAPTKTVTVNSGGAMNWTNMVEAFKNLTLNNVSLALRGGYTDPPWGALNIYGTLTGTGTSSITAVSGNNNTVSPGLMAGAVTLYVNVPAESDQLTIAVPIRNYNTSDTYALTKSGAGLLTLSGANTYSGNSTISAGTLALSGSGAIANSPIITIGSGASFEVSSVSGGYVLASGQTLRGVGSVNGAVTVASGAELAPGLSIGTLTMNNNLAFNAGSKAGVELNRGASPNADKVQGIATLIQGGTLYVTNNGASLQIGDSFTLFSATTYAGEFAAISAANPNSDTELAWDKPALKTNGVLRVHHVPYATNKTVVRTHGMTAKFKLSELFPSTDPLDADTVVLESFTAGAQGATITSNATYIFYVPANNNSDAFTYTVTDGRGGKRTATNTVSVVDTPGQGIGVVVSGGQATVNFAGIPGYPYTAERATNVTWDGITRTWPTNAPADGLFQIIDDFSDVGFAPPEAWYRLKYSP